MRALLDANIFIRYLLSHRDDSATVIAVEAAFTHAYTLLLTEHLIGGVVNKTESKPYLSNRITRADTERLIAALRIVAEPFPELEEPLPEVGNDRKDAYLFAHALVAQVDYLVSSDRDVRNIGRIGQVKIVTPAEFARILEDNGLA